MTAPPSAPATVSLLIDGRQLEVPRGMLIIRAAEELGIVIPRFCDHPLLDPVAACRQCLVEVEGQRKPITACSTPCTDGMVVKTHLTSETARRDQEGQLEFLLINHPLDCPQCDKGGECPLQDQALAHGPSDTRFVDAKRRYTKAVPISPQILLDRERCVLCARCTRFSQEISGDPFIELFERGALEQVSIYADEPYHSYFSGNVVQICPVGALTATSYRFRSRPFDLRSVSGVCNQCANGCNLRIDVRYGEIQRQLARDNMAVNQAWNCDKGRFGYGFVHHDDRLGEPAVRDDLGTLQPAGWVAALQAAAAGLRAGLAAGGPAAVGVIGGGRLTDEDAYALSRFSRDVLGTDNVDFRMAPRTQEELSVLAGLAGTVGPTYDDVEQAPVVIVAGLETEEEAPILHLRLRKAVRQRGQRIIVVGPVVGSLEGIAWRWIATGAGEETATLTSLGAGASAAGPPPDREVLDREVLDAVSGAGAALIVLAGERLARSPGALSAAAGLAGGTGGRFAWVPRRANARGAVDAGLLPGLLPGGRSLDDPGPLRGAWGRLPETRGLDTRGMLEAAANGELRALYLAGADPLRDFEDPALARRALERVDTLIMADLLPTETAHHADVLLPACAPQERAGSFTTWEGRRQPFPPAVAPKGLALTDWDILRQLAKLLGTDLGWETAGDVRREAAPLMEAAGQPVPQPAPELTQAVPQDREADQPADSLAVVAVPSLLGSGSMLAGAKALLETARAPAVWVNPVDAARLGLAYGAGAAVVGPDGRLELPVRVTAAVTEGVVVVPANGPVPAGVLSQGTGPVRARLEALVGAG